MSDRKHCVPNTSLCAIFVLKETVKEPESASKYTHACAGGYVFKRFASTPCWNRIFSHCQREKHGDTGEGACSCVSYAFNYWQVWTNFNEKLVVNTLNLSTDAYTECSALVLPNIAMLIYEPFLSNNAALSTYSCLSATTPPRAFGSVVVNQPPACSLLHARRTVRAKRRSFWTVIGVTQLNSDQCYVAEQWSVLHSWTVISVT